MPTTIRAFLPIRGSFLRDASGLIYLNARYYDPQIGQFISPDTLVPNATNVFDYNRYMYARGNPMKYNDPSGHCVTNQNGSRAKSDAQCWQLVDTISAIWNQHPNYWDQRFKISNENWLEKVASAQQFDTKYMNNELNLYLHSSSFKSDFGFTPDGYLPGPVPSHPIEQFDVNLPDCNKVDCTSLVINHTIVGLDIVSMYASGGAAVAQTTAVGCATVGLIPCVGAAEAAAGALGTVSTVASAAGAGLTAVQVVRNKASAKDLSVSLTSTLLGAQGGTYLGNAGASENVAKLGGAAMGFGVSLLQYEYDTR